MVNDREIALEIVDTAGDPHLGVNRQEQYNHTDGFLLCVAVSSPTSLGTLDGWVQEIREVCRDAPIFLVLTKKDMLAEMDEDEDDFVSMQMVEAAVQQRGQFTGSFATSSKEY